MSEEAESTYSVTEIEPPNFKEALELLKQLKESEPSPEEAMMMIATIAKIKGWQTQKTILIPKGMVLIGEGETFDFNKPITLKNDQPT